MSRTFKIKELPVTVTVYVDVEVEVDGQHRPATREEPEEWPEWRVEFFETDQDNVDDMVGMALDDFDWDREIAERFGED